MPAIPPSGSHPIPPISSQDPVQAIKDYFANLAKESGTMGKLGTDIGNAIASLTTVQSITQGIQNFFDAKTPAGVDIYLDYYSNGDFDISSCLAQVSSDIEPILGANFSLPPTTLADDVYANLSKWPNQDPGITAIGWAIAKAIFNEIGSSGTPSQLSSCVAAVLTDPAFFSNYAQISYSDLQALMNVLDQSGSFSIPDFAQYYLQLGYKSSPSILESALLQEMRNVWSTGNTATLQAWLVNTIADPNFMHDFPGIDGFSIASVASEMGIAIPNWFGMLFDGILSFLEEPSNPTPDDYKMVMDFQSKWSAVMFADPSMQLEDLENWFDTNFGTPGQPYPPGMTDLYMLYPLGDGQIIEKMGGMFSQADPPSLYVSTSADAIYRAVYAAGHGNDASGVYFDLLAECRKVGSEDANQAVENWIDNLAIEGFSSYPTMTPKDVINFLSNFDIVTTINGNNISYIADFISGYIQNIWLEQPGRTPEDKVFGNTFIAQIQAWAGGEAPPGKLSDLQTYIANAAQTDLFKFTGIAGDIIDLITLFGFTP